MEQKKGRYDMTNNEITKATELVLIPIEKLHPHPDNPRKELGDLSELADSIKARGIMQNLTVVPCTGYYHGDYTVIIGHRRTEAARLAGLTHLPCVITEMSEKEQIATMLLENMQRSDLTVYEQAKGFQMMFSFGESAAEISEKTGFSESTIRRRMKLLELDEERFKESEARGGTITDYIELDKIKDSARKNKVLESIGTNNFRYELERNIKEEEKEEYLDNVEAEMGKFAVKVDEASYSDGFRIVTSYATWDREDVQEPEDAGEREYYYVRDLMAVRLYYKEEVLAKEEEDEAVVAAERAREERIAELQEEAQMAYKLRERFVSGVSGSKIQKYLCDVLAFWLWYEDEWENIEELELDEEEISPEDIAEAIRGKEFAILWKIVSGKVYDSKDWNYYNPYTRGESFYKENEDLSEWYKLLEKMGYEMSDAEKEMQSGTSELYRLE